MSLKNKCIGNREKAVKKSAKRLRRNILSRIKNIVSDGDYQNSSEFNELCADLKLIFDYFWVFQNPKDFCEMTHEYA